VNRRRREEKAEESLIRSSEWRRGGKGVEARLKRSLRERRRWGEGIGKRLKISSRKRRGNEKRVEGSTMRRDEMEKAERG